MKYTKEELEDLIITQNLPYEEIGRRFGVTGNAIRKAAKKLGITLSPRRKICDTETFNKGKNLRYCANCGKPLKSYQESYCSKQCFWEFSRKSYIDRWFRNWGC